MLIEHIKLRIHNEYSYLNGFVCDLKWTFNQFGWTIAMIALGHLKRIEKCKKHSDAAASTEKLKLNANV